MIDRKFWIVIKIKSILSGNYCCYELLLNKLIVIEFDIAIGFFKLIMLV